MPRVSLSYGPLSDDGSSVLPHAEVLKPSKSRPKPAPPPEFRRHFDRLVLPIAARRIRVNGTFVALGIMSYADALDDVLATLRARGASYLPSHDWDALEDRVATALLQRVDEVEQVVEATRIATRDISP